MDELMTIGAFAERTGLSVSALRFYAERRLLVPAEVDAKNGYRRYADTQIPDAMLIRDLRLLDMPLADIARALRRSEQDRRLLVEHHLRRLDQVISRAHRVARRMGVGESNNHSHSETSMTETPSTSTTSASATLADVDLNAVLKQILPVAGTDPEQPHLMTVLIEARDGSVRFVATDRYRLAIRDLIPISTDGDFSAVIPAASLNKWSAELDGAAGADSSAGPGAVEVTVHEREIRATGIGVELTAPLMPVTFPDYEPHLRPADNVTSVTVNRAELLEKLDGFGASNKNETTIHWSTSSEGVSITDLERTAEIAAASDGPDRNVAMNLGFAIDATAGAVGADVVVDIESSLDPMLFRSADDGTFTTRVMPIKLD